jgi:hypothetical protein
VQTDSLSYLNAIIGFCGSDKTWPNPLARLGFRAFHVEKEITVSLRGQQRTVVADLLLCSVDESHAVCLELKSAHVDKAQLDKYQAIVSDDLFDQGLVESQIQRSMLTHDITYVSNEENAKTLRRKLPSLIPFVTGSRTRFSQVRGKGKCEALDRILYDGIDVDIKSWPSSYIRFTSETEDIAPILQSVLTSMASRIISASDFSREEISSDSVPHWEMCGTKERTAFANRIERLVNETANSELADYIEKLPKAQGIGWRCKKAALEHAASIVALHRHIAEHLQRKVDDRPFNPPRPGQKDIEQFRDV